MIPSNKNTKKIKLFNSKTLSASINFNCDISSSSRTFLDGDTKYRITIDLTQYDWCPKNIVAILPSQAFKLNDGNIRALVLPDYDNPTKKVDIYAPSAGTYYPHFLILYEG